MGNLSCFAAVDAAGTALGRAPRRAASDASAAAADGRRGGVLAVRVERANIPPREDEGVSARRGEGIEGAEDGGVEAGNEDRVDGVAGRIERRPAAAAARN